MLNKYQKVIHGLIDKRIFLNDSTFRRGFTFTCRQNEYRAVSSYGNLKFKKR